MVQVVLLCFSEGCLVSGRSHNQLGLGVLGCSVQGVLWQNYWT